MNLKYDPKADALYIRFSAEKPTRTEEIRDDFMLDYNGDKLIGIEILDLSKKIPNKSLENVSVALSSTLEL